MNDAVPAEETLLHYLALHCPEVYGGITGNSLDEALTEDGKAYKASPYILAGFLLFPDDAILRKKWIAMGCAEKYFSDNYRTHDIDGKIPVTMVLDYMELSRFFRDIGKEIESRSTASRKAGYIAISAIELALRLPNQDKKSSKNQVSLNSAIAVAMKNFGVRDKETLVKIWSKYGYIAHLASGWLCSELSHEEKIKKSGKPGNLEMSISLLALRNAKSSLQVLRGIRAHVNTTQGNNPFNLPYIWLSDKMRDRIQSVELRTDKADIKSLS